MCPYACTIGNEILLHEDNARLYSTRFVADYFQCMQWPAQSPDMNCAEYVWDALGRCITALISSPQTLALLITALQEQWLTLFRELIGCIIESMHRCVCYIASRSDYTPTEGTFSIPNLHIYIYNCVTF